MIFIKIDVTNEIEINSQIDRSPVCYTSPCSAYGVRSSSDVCVQIFGVWLSSRTRAEGTRTSGPRKKSRELKREPPKERNEPPKELKEELAS